MSWHVDHIDGTTFHGRKGALDNAFTYSVDYVFLNAEKPLTAPWPFRRNRPGWVSLLDEDHGGAPGKGKGAPWVRELLQSNGLPFSISKIYLLAQPRVLGHVFNPVSFWIVYDDADQIRVVIPEVTNTYGDRHSYICRHEDWRPIGREDNLSARKLLHVSPFQPIEGEYEFRFDIRPEKIGVWIDYTTDKGGLLATLTGNRRPLSTWIMLKAMARRPFGSRRVLGLIHWQALKLWIKGAAFRARPEPPAEEVSR